MHDEYTMRSTAGSVIDASPIRRLDCAGFQLDVDSGNPEARDVPMRTLRKRLSKAKKQNSSCSLAVGQARDLTPYKQGFVPSTSGARCD
jgi:hypothetical protein